MDGDLLKEKVLTALKTIPPFYYLPAGILAVGLVFIVIGIVELTSSSTKPEQLPLEAAAVTPKPSLIEIDVEGAVMNPGVYQLPSGSRLKDALIAAGGLSKNADRVVVAKQLNLAVKVTDGGKVYIPRVGETPLANSQQSSNTPILGTTTGLVDVNTASLEQLDSLPGVGQVTAQKIIDSRPYASVEELLSKKAVGNAVYEKIKDKVSVF